MNKKKKLEYFNQNRFFPECITVVITIIFVLPIYGVGLIIYYVGSQTGNMLMNLKEK